eukprot:2645902-Prymnesium_polylepis.1
MGGRAEQAMGVRRVAGVGCLVERPSDPSPARRPVSRPGRPFMAVRGAPAAGRTRRKPSPR